jgi:hypothetical protein
LASVNSKNRALKLTQKKTFEEKGVFDTTRMGLSWGINNPKFTDTLYEH